MEGVEYLLINKKDLLNMIKSKKYSEINKKIKEYEIEKTEIETMQEEIHNIESEIENLRIEEEELSKNYPANVEKKFNFFERFIFKRAEYREQRRIKEEQEKRKNGYRRRIKELTEKKELLSKDISERQEAFEMSEFKKLKEEYEKYSNASSIEELGLTEEMAIQIVENENLKIFINSDEYSINEFIRAVQSDGVERYGISSEVLKVNVEKGFRSTVSNFEYIDGHIIDAEDEIQSRLSRLPDEYKKCIQQIIDELGEVPFLVDSDNGLLSQKCIEKLGIENVIRLYKFSYLPYNINNPKGTQFVNIRIDYNELFNSDNFNYFMDLYTNILKNDINPISITTFNKIAYFYLNNRSIINEIMQNPDLREKLTTQLRIYFLSTSIADKDNNIQSIEELQTIGNRIRERLISKAKKSGYFSCEDFFRTLIGDDSGSANIWIMNTKKIKKLYFELISMDESNKEQLDFLADLMCLYEFIERVGSYKIGNVDKYTVKHEHIFGEIDFEEFYNMMLNLSDEDIEFLYSKFGCIQEKIMALYGQELSQKLLKTKSIIDGEKATDASEIVEDYAGTGVKYVILRDRGTFIQHVMNAYVRNYDGATLDVFDKTKKRSVISRTIISCSSITNQRQDYIDRSKLVGGGTKFFPDSDEEKTYGIHDKNDVVLLFLDVDPTSLVNFGPNDCGIQTTDNSIESTNSYVMAGMATFRYDTVEETIESFCGERNCGYGTEYILLFEDQNGRRIRPSAVRVMGDEPSKYEIQAAMELGVPLVKIERAIEQEKSEEKEQDIQLTPSKRLMQIISRLSKNFDILIEKNPVTIEKIVKKDAKGHESVLENDDGFDISD